MSHRRWQSWCGSQRLPAGAETADGGGPCHCANPQGSLQDGRAGDLPFGLGTALCEEDAIAVGGIAVVVFEGSIQW